MTRHLAVDPGASGGRVAPGTIEDGKLAVEILHRRSHGGVPANGHLYWNILGIWQEILAGLAKSSKPVESVVDAWGVDYALIDEMGNLLDGVHHYRRGRTKGAMEELVAILSRRHIYEATGVRLMPINTLYQSEAHRLGSRAFNEAARMLMVPDLIHYWLSGHMANERTIASTTQLYSAKEGLLAGTVVVPADLPMHWLPLPRSTFLPDHGLSTAELDAADTVLTLRAVAIAETGTVVLDHAAGQGRRALTLVPDHHVVIVAAERIVDSVPKALAALAESVRAGRPLTWISGPSATSDIELTRVEGGHGPRRLDIVIVEK